MAISDGDPRVLVPEFLSTFNWCERNQSIRYYGLRHGSSGKNYPPDEAAASVARRAMVLGAYSANVALGSLLFFALITWNLFAPDAVYLDTPALVGLGVGGMAIGSVVGYARHRRINRYFAANFAGSLDFRAGTTAA